MTQQARIGIFLAGTLVILAAVIFVVGDFGRFLHRAGYSIYASFDTVAGLDTRATVRLSGVSIGYVKDIRLKGPHPVVEMALEPWAKVPAGSKATLSTLGLLGEKYVEILPGKQEAIVKPGGTITSMGSVSFDQLGLLIMSIGEEVKGVSARVQSFLGEENAVRFSQVLDSLAQTSASFNDFVKNNRSGLDNSIRSVEHAFQSFDEDVTRVADSFTEASRQLNGLLSENRSGIKEDVDKLKAVLDQMNDAAQRLSSVLKKMDQGQGSLGKLIVDPELYNEAKETIEGVQTTVKPLAGLHPFGDARVTYYSDSKVWKGTLTFGAQLATGPFVFGQIVRDPFESTGRKFSYSLEFGRRWGAFAPRVGVIESDFGFGLDYFAFRDRFEISLEGYEFDRHPQPRLRLTSRYFPTRYFFLVLGLDEAIWARQRELFFGLGVGLQ